MTDKQKDWAKTVSAIVGLVAAVVASVSFFVTLGVSWERRIDRLEHRTTEIEKTQDRVVKHLLDKVGF